MYRITKKTNALNFHFHHITSCEEDWRSTLETHTCWCARRNNGPWFKGHNRTDKCDQFRNRKNHLRRMCVLQCDSVDPRAQLERLRIGNLPGGDNAHTHRAEGI